MKKTIFKQQANRKKGGYFNYEIRDEINNQSARGFLGKKWKLPNLDEYDY